MYFGNTLGRCRPYVSLFKTKARDDFKSKTISLVKKLVDYLPIDDGVDQVAKTFIHESLPPCLTERKFKKSIKASSKSNRRLINSHKR
jgi:hypothetical protein